MAVDAASNQSAWSQPLQLQSGAISAAVLIVLIAVVVVVVIVLVIYFLVLPMLKRRKVHKRQPRLLKPTLKLLRL